MRIPADIKAMLHAHYDRYQPEQSAFPESMLQMDFFVPGSTSRCESDRYKGHPLFREILTCDALTCAAYMKRVIQDFTRNADRDASRAKKACRGCSEFTLNYIQFI